MSGGRDVRPAKSKLPLRIELTLAGLPAANASANCGPLIVCKTNWGKVRM
jgi:hypothetical protein